METSYYLVECMNGGSEFNIYNGSEIECNTEMKRIIDSLGEKANPMYVTCNRFE
jgi:hypothetical protein